MPAASGGIARSTYIAFDPTQGRNYFQWVTLHRSMDLNGEPTLVSSTVFVPLLPWSGPGPRPIVGYAPGTQGLGDQCAVSKLLGLGNEIDLAAIRPMINAGMAVAVTDYQGLGPPGDHPFLVADAAAYNVLDSIRAAINLPDAGLDPAAPIGLFGYSQGAQAAGRAAELQPWYAPDLNLRGAVVGGTPADIARTDEFLGPDATGLKAGLLLFAAIGLDSAYPELNLDAYLNQAGRELVGQARSQCALETLLSNVDASIDQYTTTSPLDAPDWQARMAQQALGRQAPPVPVRIVHARADGIVPIAQATRLRDQWCDLGVPVSFIEYDLVEHFTGVVPAGADAAWFLNRRFRGQPVSDPFCIG
jgi:pimeloyl-ACP methyl ester carboxylesterase